MSRSPSIPSSSASPSAPSTSRQPLRELVRRLPKAELHVHLEGAMRPETLLELARRHGVDLPADTPEGLADWFRFRSFDHFVEVYLACSACLREPDDFRRLALDFLEGQARQGVLWSEVHFTIGTHLGNGLDGEAVRHALEEARREGWERFGAGVGWIPDIVRNAPHHADATLEWALVGLGEGPLAIDPGAGQGGVVALGLSGTEATHSARPFEDHFREAEARGLHRVAHAGEHAGPEAVWSALEYGRAERIGHGVRAPEDPVLLEHLARERVPLEVCPTSNLCLGVFPDLPSHPFDRLRQARIPVSVGSDDPPFFATSLEDEYLRLAAAHGYGPAELAALALAGIRQSFLGEGDKARLEARLRATAEEAGEELFGEPVVPAEGFVAAPPPWEG